MAAKQNEYNYIKKYMKSYYSVMQPERTVFAEMSTLTASTRNLGMKTNILDQI